MKKRFSLITPVYNVEEYLPKCIESMINQTYRDIEIILVDDGSYDRCASICDEYALKDDRLKIIHKQNGGIVSARQVGSELAEGEYIIYVDGDDWIDLNYCEHMNNVIEKYFPDIVCCGFFKEYVDSSVEIPISYSKGLYYKEDIESKIFPTLLQSDGKGSFPLSVWAKAVKTPLLQQQQLVDVVVNIGEDIACMTPCVFHSQSIFIIDECLYHYRQTPNSMTKGKNVYSWDGPMIRGKHIENHIDISVGDFKQQLYRSTVVSLYTVVRSQFNRNDPSINIFRDIRTNLNNPYYKNAINQCCFRCDVKGKAKQLLLKYRLFLIIKMIG